MSNAKLRFLNFLLLAVSVLLSLLAAELFVRVNPFRLFHLQDFGELRSHPTRVFELVPNVSATRWGVDWRINSRGFRDYEHTVEKKNFRILGLGDSYFVGNEVSFEHTFLHRLEQRLKVEVINMAVGSYGTVQERLLWEEQGWMYKPEIVLLGVYLANDLHDNAGFRKKECVREGWLVSCADDFSRKSVQLAYNLADNSHLARLLLREFRPYLLPESSAEDEDDAEDAEDAEDAISPIRYGGEVSDIYEREWSESIARGFRILKENVLMLNQSTAAYQAQLVVIIIPVESQIYDWQWEQYTSDDDLNPAKYDRFKVVRLLVDFLEEEGIEFVNLLPALREAGKTDPNLHPGHWHWSIAANDLVARVVGGYLNHNFDIPPSRAE